MKPIFQQHSYTERHILPEMWIALAQTQITKRYHWLYFRSGELIIYHLETVPFSHSHVPFRTVHLRSIQSLPYSCSLNESFFQQALKAQWMMIPFLVYVCVYCTSKSIAFSFLDLIFVVVLQQFDSFCCARYDWGFSLLCWPTAAITHQNPKWMHQ